MHVTPQKCVTGVQTKPTGPRRLLGLSPYSAALTGCMLLNATLVPNNSTLSLHGKQKSKKFKKNGRKTKRRNAKHGLVTSYGTHLTCYLTQQQ